MRNTTLLKITLAAFLTAPAFGNYLWTNFAGDNDFANPANWSGTGNTWIVALDGVNRAILGDGHTLFLNNNFAIGRSEGGDGEVEINGSTISFERVLRLGADGFDGKLTMTNGIMNIGRGINIGQDGGSTGTLVVSGGTINANSARTNANDRLDVGADGTTGILEMSGSAVINFPTAIANIGGGLDSVATVSISGNAILTLGSGIDAEVSAGENAMSTVSIFDNGQLNVGRDARIGEGQNAEVTLDLSGDGALVAGRNARFGFGADTTVSLNVSGGVLSAANGFMTMGQAAGTNVSVNMSGGVIIADRLSFSNNADGASILNMTGGVIQVVRSGESTATTTGAFRMGPGSSTLDIGGNALIDTEKLWIDNGGLLTLSGNALIDVKGSTDGENPTFDFARAFVANDWSGVLGKISFNGGSLVVAGATNTFFLSDGATPPVLTQVTVNYADLLNAAIAEGVIYTDVAGGILEARYDAGADLTELVLTSDEAPVVNVVILREAGVLSLSIDGPAGLAVAIETSTDLTANSWTEVDVVTLGVESTIWTDPNPAHAPNPRRFYRGRIGEAVMEAMGN
ncbi:MAG: hypothetical protein JJT96_16330 [Opitutales bacterium]|nr:hypothetical protein [Opitutales bacterium]